MSSPPTQSRRCRDVLEIATNNGTSRSMSNKTNPTKSKSGKIRGRSSGIKLIAANSAADFGNKQGTLNSAASAGPSRQRIVSAKPSKKKSCRNF